MIAKIVCVVSGHRYNVVAVNWRKHVNLFHLHGLAGCKAYCTRCGDEWDDLWSPFFDDEIKAVTQPPQPLPRMWTL